MLGIDALNLTIYSKKDSVRIYAQIKEYQI